MPSNWPTSIDNFGHVSGGEATNQPNDAGLTHAMIHNLLADAVTKLETRLQNNAGGGGPDINATPTLIGTTDPFQSPYSGTNAGNTALGSNALGIVSVGGSGNGNQIHATAIGYAALDNNNGSQSDNTAIGFAAANQYSGNFGTAVGVNALYTALGDRNVGVGHAAGTSANGFAFTGSDNVSVGYQALHGALAAATSGSSNVALGSQAMSLSAGVSGDVAVGFQALKHDTGGTNIAIGYQALQANTTGIYNTVIGYQAASPVTSVNNIVIGYQAMGNATGAGANIAIGYQSMFNSTGGSTNTAVGSTTLYWNSTGIYNTAFGVSALQSNTTGIGNTGIGLDALALNSTGSYNTALGYNANYNNVAATPSYSMVLGASTLATANGAIAIGTDHAGTGASSSIQDLFVLGTSNHTVSIPGFLTYHGTSIAIPPGTTTQYLRADGTWQTLGAASLVGETKSSGNVNTAIGYNALGLTSVGATESITGNHVVAIGYNALSSATSANQSVAVGTLALQSTTIGYDNVAIGHNAMHTSVNGVQNVGVGSLALQFNTSDNNTAIGYATLALSTADSKNIALGAWALNQLNGGSSNIAIGYQANSNPFTNNYTLAIGTNTQAIADGAVAIGTDHLGNAAGADAQDLFALGTAHHTINIAGAVNINTTNASGVGIQTGIGSGGIGIVDNGTSGILIASQGGGNLVINALGTATMTLSSAGGNLSLSPGSASLKLATSNTQKVGFYGSTGAAQGTITGSRGANAALASLLTYLASLGILIDSTT